MLWEMNEEPQNMGPHDRPVDVPTVAVELCGTEAVNREMLLKKPCTAYVKFFGSFDVRPVHEQPHLRMQIPPQSLHERDAKSLKVSGD